MNTEKIKLDEIDWDSWLYSAILLSMAQSTTYNAAGVLENAIKQHFEPQIVERDTKIAELGRLLELKKALVEKLTVTCSDLEKKVTLLKKAALDSQMVLGDIRPLIEGFSDAFCSDIDEALGLLKEALNEQD